MIIVPSKSSNLLIAGLTALALLLCACASKHSAVIVMPGYEKGFAIDANVAVVVLDYAPEILYRGDALKSLREFNVKNDTSAETVMFDYFRSRLPEDIVREVDVTGAFFAAVRHRYLVTKEVVKTRDIDATVEIPDSNTRFEFDTARTALVLLLNDIYIGTETDPYYADRAQHGFYTVTARKLMYRASFVLWDNRKLRPICYGLITSAQSISREEATKENWEAVSRDFVRQMFAETGFLRQKDRN